MTTRTKLNPRQIASVGPNQESTNLADQISGFDTSITQLNTDISDININFTEASETINSLSEDVINIQGVLSDLGAGPKSYKGPVDNVNSLPVSSDNDGDVYLIMDSSSFVRWSATLAVYKPVGGSGSGQSDGLGATNAISESSSVALVDGITNVVINQFDYNPLNDVLRVYFENLRLYEPDNYTRSEDGRSINLIGFSLKAGEKLQFEVLKDVSDNLGNLNLLDTNSKANIVSAINEIKSAVSTYGSGVANGTFSESTYVADSDGITNIVINEGHYNRVTDILKVYLDNLRLYEFDNYIRNDDGVTIDLIGFSLDIGDKLQFEVWSDMSSNVGDLTELNTDNKLTIVSAINELILTTSSYTDSQITLLSEAIEGQLSELINTIADQVLARLAQ